MSGPTLWRRGLARLPGEALLERVDELDLRPGARISPAVALPLRSLRQRRDVEEFVSHAPAPAVRALLESLVAPDLERIVELLGEHADRPSFDQLAAAVDAMAAEGVSDDRRAALLAFAVAEQFAAAPHCRRLLAESPELALPSVDVVSTSPAMAPPREVDPEVRERRRQRRAARPASPAPSRPSRPSRARRPAVVEDGALPDVSLAPPKWRRTPLTPVEARTVSDRHPLVGALVTVDVPFDAVDPSRPDEHEKHRPALVVAGSTSQLLVRALYTKSRPGRIPFPPWRRVGLDHPSFVSDHRILLDIEGREVVEIDRLTAVEWNALW
ncbi:MAG: hypothetical protein ACP5OV_02155 [Acidimicrobiales bacterium]